MIHGAAQFAIAKMAIAGTPDWNRYTERWDNELHYLPEERGRRAFLITWRQWWEEKYGVEAGMKLDEYCRAHGIA